MLEILGHRYNHGMNRNLRLNTIHWKRRFEVKKTVENENYNVNKKNSIMRTNEAMRMNINMKGGDMLTD